VADFVEDAKEKVKDVAGVAKEKASELGEKAEKAAENTLANTPEAECEGECEKKEVEKPIEFKTAVFDPRSEYAQDSLQRAAELGKELKGGAKDLDELIRETVGGDQP